MAYQKHCPGCFADKAGAAVCPSCGYDESAPRSPLFLPHGTLLAGQYRIGRVLGRPGGFGITYLAWDVHLQQRLAIKEYLPRDLSGRDEDHEHVTVHTEQDRAGFEAGREQFLREARTVARLDHPNIVRARAFLNANGTAYLVMDYYEGMSLGDHLAEVRRHVPATEAVDLLLPVLDGLAHVHAHGVMHRDIKPHNIYLTASGRPILLDFGAARRPLVDNARSLSVVLTEGYAPLEQYQRRAQQGPWTDVYSMAATLFRMITGQPPPNAMDRLGQDPLDAAQWPGVPAGLRPILAQALALRAEARTADAGAFAEALKAWRAGPPDTEIPPLDLPWAANPAGPSADSEAVTAVPPGAAPPPRPPPPKPVAPAIAEAAVTEPRPARRAEDRRGADRRGAIPPPPNSGGLSPPLIYGIVGLLVLLVVLASLILLRLL